MLEVYGGQPVAFWTGAGGDEHITVTGTGIGQYQLYPELGHAGAVAIGYGLEAAGPVIGNAASAVIEKAAKPSNVAQAAVTGVAAAVGGQAIGNGVSALGAWMAGDSNKRPSSAKKMLQQ